MVFEVFLVILPLLFGLTSSQSSGQIIVNTVAGRVLGKRIVAKTIGAPDREVDAFLGIPFAENPTADRRFRPPVAKQPWDNLFNATYYGHGCLHFPDDAFPGFRGSEMWNSPVELSEDCLNLNVWTPYPRPTDATVMVWIYGGGFYSGVSSLDVYDGRYMAAEQNVVVVSMNYRLGALGFLMMGESTAPGNHGLRDQALALQWVQDNIRAFGGSPNKVTIFGESAGAASVSLHMLSPFSRDLFHRAIMQSTAATAPWAAITEQESIRRGEILAKALQCDIDTNGNNMTTDQMVHCMRSRDPIRILEAQWVTNGFMEFPFVPVIDNTFITEVPWTTLKRQSFKSAEILIGSNLNEANFYLIYEVPGFSKDHESLLNRDKFYDAVQYCFPQVNTFGQDSIAFQYTDWLAPYDELKLRDAVDYAVGDYKFTCSTYDFAYAYAEAGNAVYYYRFLERDSTNPWPEWMGVLHGDEILYVFGMPLKAESNNTEIEVMLSRKIMTYWANFAKTGNPNKATESDPDGEWPQYTTTKQKFLELTEDLANGNPSVGQGPRADKCAFWREYLPSLQIQTGDIKETERIWKEEFNQWYTRHLVNWKAEFAHYINNKDADCGKQ